MSIYDTTSKQQVRMTNEVVVTVLVFGLWTGGKRGTTTSLQ